MNRLPVSLVDLHIHSLVSEGSLEPTAIAARTRSLGLRLVALTDHDRLEGSLELVSLIPDRALVGIELSCVDEGDAVDLLGLGLREPGRLAATIAWPAINVMRYRLWADALAKIGVRLDPEAPLKGLPARRVIGAAIATSSTIQATLGGSSWPDNLGKAMSKGGPADISGALAHSGLLPEVSVGIRRIQAAGGVAVWAHPGFNLSQGQALEPRLGVFVEAGLEGLEVYHPAHDSSVRRRLAAAARHYGLLRTAGSDTHDNPDDLGRSGLIPLEVLESLLARFGSHLATESR